MSPIQEPDSPFGCLVVTDVLSVPGHPPRPESVPGRGVREVGLDDVRIDEVQPQGSFLSKNFCPLLPHPHTHTHIVIRLKVERTVLLSNHIYPHFSHFLLAESRR